MCQFLVSGGQSIGAPASASILPMNIQGPFPLGMTGLISLPCIHGERIQSRVGDELSHCKILDKASPALASDHWAHRCQMNELVNQ